MKMQTSQTQSTSNHTKKRKSLGALGVVISMNKDFKLIKQDENYNSGIDFLI